VFIILFVFAIYTAAVAGYTIVMSGIYGYIASSKGYWPLCTPLIVAAVDDGEIVIIILQFL
jgi:hypothetical protein